MSDLPKGAIAVIGMACRFPGARCVDDFWRNLRDGIESIIPLSDEVLRSAGVKLEEFERPNYVKAAAVLDGVERFDAEFFGFSPKEASIMDPQHRHFLECSWEALEHAGYDSFSFEGSIGVFAGRSMRFLPSLCLEVALVWWFCGRWRMHLLKETVFTPLFLALP